MQPRNSFHYILLSYQPPTHTLECTSPQAVCSESTQTTSMYMGTELKKFIVGMFGSETVGLDVCEMPD